MSVETAFDSAAKEYDDVFTKSLVGRLQRRRVYHWLNHWSFNDQKHHILEINGGTGEDAQYFEKSGHQVLFTDISEKMVEYARLKLQNSICLSSDMISAIDHYRERKCDVIFSNFGGLNCLSPAELNLFFSQVSLVQAANNHIYLVIMPAGCLVENLYFFFTFRWRRMFRRRRSKLSVNVGDTQVNTYYHNPRRIKKLLRSNGYYNISSKPVAIVLPPSYLTNKVGNTMGKVLYFFERLFGSFSLFSIWSDHYIIKAIKK